MESLQYFLQGKPSPVKCEGAIREFIMKIRTQPLEVCTERILGEGLLISSLPGKALRMLVDIARLAERFNMRSRS